MTVALAMSSDLLAAGGTEEDRLLATTLVRSGVPAELVAWDGGIDWGELSGVLVRSCWDYHLRAQDFRGWLDRLESVEVPVWNPIPLLRWNMDKRYLLDLAERGLPVVPTLSRERVDGDSIAELGRYLQSEELMIKPVIGATAHGCRRVRVGGDPGEADADGPWLIQPFVGSIAERGEWSLMLFDGELSHAVLKRPAAGEYRVQKEWGGSWRRAEPARGLVEVARRVVETLDPVPTYARADLALWHGEPHLMELELIEPELFLEEGDPGLSALVERLAGR